MIRVHSAKKNHPKLASHFFFATVKKKYAVMGCCCSANHQVDDAVSFHKMKSEEEEEEEDPSSDDEDSTFECSICLGTSQKRLQATPCMHVFHAKCLRDWMRRKPECPVCRLKLVVV